MIRWPRGAPTTRLEGMDHTNSATHSDAVTAEPDYRFTLANERTFLAWQRTSLGLLAASVGVLQFLPDDSGPGLRYGLGGVLGLLAVVTAAGGLHRWRRNDHAIRRDQPLPRLQIAGYLSFTLVAIGLVAVAVAVIATITL